MELKDLRKGRIFQVEGDGRKGKLLKKHPGSCLVEWKKPKVVRINGEAKFKKKVKERISPYTEVVV